MTTNIVVEKLRGTGDDLDIPQLGARPQLCCCMLTPAHDALFGSLNAKFFCTAYASLECTNVISQCLIAGSDRLCYSQCSRRATDLRAKVFNHLRSLVTSSAFSYSSRLDVHCIFPASQSHFRVEAIVTDAILASSHLNPNFAELA